MNAMFYMKHKGKKLFIEEGNVFNACPLCGRETAVDLQAVLSDGEGDLYGTQVYCHECSERRAKERKAQEAAP